MVPTSADIGTQPKRNADAANRAVTSSRYPVQLAGFIERLRLFGSFENILYTSVRLSFVQNHFCIRKGMCLYRMSKWQTSTLLSSRLMLVRLNF